MNLLETNISVPRLQRDYVQGTNENIIRPFINDLMNGADAIDLNYIYGTTDNNGNFQPVDGQQRLTTIWLLRLCLSKAAGVEFNVSLQYDAREFANEYCKQLSCATVDEIRNPRQAAWYLKVWGDDYSVRAMNSALRVIWKYMPSNKEDILTVLHSLDNRLKYCALMLGGDINEDIYIKMNRRGVQLSAFENLKSWLDKQAETANKYTPDFSKNWKDRMDSSWSAMMWDLADKSDTEKDICIDDLMLNCIYSFAHCYLSKIKEDVFNKYFNDNESNKQDAQFTLDLRQDGNIYECCLERISSPKNKMRLELYQLDILPIFTKDCMQFIYDCMERLSEVYTAINKCSYNFYSDWQPSDSESLLVHLINDNTYQSRTLLFALSAFTGSESTPFDSWIYRIRNLVVNSNINASTIHSIISGIESLATYCGDYSINDVLLGKRNNDSEKLFPLTGFSKEQLQEESTKSNLNPEVWDEVKATENHGFFLGRVSFLFDFAGENPSLENIKPYTFYMQSLFNDTTFTNGIGNSLRLAMLPFGWFGYYGQYGNWSFLKTREEKQRFIYDNDIDKETLLRDTPHNYVLQAVIDKLYDRYGLISPTSEMLQQIATALYEQIKVDDSRKYFSYIEIWKKMGEHQLRSNGETRKILFEKTRGNCHQIDLWNYRLYIDLTSRLNNGLLKKYESLFPGWNFDKWAEGGESCVYLDKPISNGEKIAIDVWHNPNEYDCFGVSIFIRENTQKTIELLEPILDNVRYGYVLKNDRYITQNSISREKLENYLIDIVSELNRIV